MLRDTKVRSLFLLLLGVKKKSIEIGTTVAFIMIDHKYYFMQEKEK
jgi:hypothetical protein